MKSRLAFLLVGALAASSCTGQSGEGAPEAAATPQMVVADWVAALEAVDVGVLADTTMPANLALIAGAENAFTIDQLASIADLGLPQATARSYWMSFRDSVGGFLGSDVSSVTVTAADPFTVGTRSYSAVTISSGDTSTEVLTRLDPDGWKVDLVATVGPALAVQIRRLVATLVEEAGDATAYTYAREAVDSLSAALARAPGDRALELELEAIEDLPIDLSR
jgi:hypothetical protein